jgi:hypothetical protein
LPQYPNGSPSLPGVGQQTDEGLQRIVQAVEDTHTASAPSGCVPVKQTIGVLNQGDCWSRSSGVIEVVENGKIARRSDFENGAEAKGSSGRCHSVEDSVVGLDQTCMGGLPIGTVETVQNGEFAG